MSDPLTDPLPEKVPENYDGQTLCARCGDGWPHCNVPGVSHQEACKVYRSGDWLCVFCTLIMETDEHKDLFTPAPHQGAE